LERISPPVSVRISPNIVIQKLSKEHPPGCRIADRKTPVDHDGSALLGARKLDLDHSTGAAPVRLYCGFARSVLDALRTVDRAKRAML
jgi:hypothetical protein